MLRLIAKLLKALNSETEPEQISLALSFSMVAGLTPILCLHNLLILLLVLVLRVNISTFIVGWVFFSGLAYLLDPLFHWIGLGVLTSESLEGIWIALYKWSLFRLEKFNNSIVMGSLLFSLAAFVPCFFLANKLIIKYRENVLKWVEKTKIMKALKASKMYGLYQSISGLGGLP